MNMMSRLMHAAHDGDVQRLKQCLLDGDDIDAIASCVTADGNKLLFVTALYLAAQQGHYDICKFLVDHGANSTIQCYSPPRQSGIHMCVRCVGARTPSSLVVFEIITNTIYVKNKTQHTQAERIVCFSLTRSILKSKPKNCTPSTLRHCIRYSSFFAPQQSSP